MSRVEQALKRARSLKSGEPVEGFTPDLHTVDAPVVASWQYERFPTERDLTPVPERRVKRERQHAIPFTAAAPPAPADRSKLATRPVVRTASPEFAPKIIRSRGGLMVREHYDRIAAALHHAQRQQDTRLLMFSSALPGEGKSLTAANVAMTLSLYGRRVLLVDADVRRPTLHELFDVPNETGLLDGLGARSDQPMPIVDVAPRLSLLPAGRSQVEPMRLLIGDRMRELLHDASRTYDWVIVDTPPVCLVSDAHILAGIVPAVVLVVRAGSTPHELVTASIATLGRERILGVVLNGVDDREVVGGYGGYEYGTADLTGRP